MLALLPASLAAAQVPDEMWPPVDLDPIPKELSLVPQKPVGPEEVSLLPEESRLQDADMQLATLEPPAAVESSGSWLRSGAYYFEADAVVLSRDTRNRLSLAEDASGSGDRLALSSGVSGVAASARLTLGHCLFRDQYNRTHSFQFTYTGMGDWVTSDTLAGRTSTGLISSIDPFDGTLDAIGGFNFGTLQEFRYESDFDSFEWNYHIEQRLGDDLLVLKPGGPWVQQARNGQLLSYLFGVRYLKLEEGFEYLSTNELDIDDINARRGTLAIDTGNHLVGLQIGGSWMQQFPRCNIGVRGKVGPYVNFAHQRTALETIDPVLRTMSRTGRAEDEVMALVAELGVFVRYHFRPNFSLRIAYEALWVDAVALAPEQIDFSPEGVALVANVRGTSMYQGFSLGWEVLW